MASELRAGLDVTPILHLLRPLAEGGMGKVWIARHKGLETEVVVKFLHTDGPDREDAAARFAREASAAAAVKSPHVVQVFDHGVTAEGVRYIVMELLEGRDLATHLHQNGPMSAPDVAAVIAQVGKALSKAHQVGVIHRDIKPENIFLCDAEGGEMFVKVLDFGVAKREHQLTAQTTTGQVVGTPFYMSPEQILGEGAVDARSDIWAMGVVAFEALTGKRPFDGTTVGAITLAIHRSSPRPSALAPGLPPAVDAWFARACAREPAERFANAREASQAILAAVQGVPSERLLVRAPSPTMTDSDPMLGGSDPPPTAERAVTGLSSTFPAPVPRRSPPAIMLAGAGVVIALLGLLVFFAVRGGNPPPAAAETVPSATASLASAGASLPTSPGPALAPPSATTDPAGEPPATAGQAPSAHPNAPATARPPPARTAAKPAGRPPRRPNDDDIK